MLVSSCCEAAIRGADGTLGGPEHFCEICGGVCAAVPDTLLRCSTCGREQRVEYSTVAAGGWPECHRHTMVLVRTSADLSSATGELFDAARAAARGGRA